MQARFALCGLYLALCAPAEAFNVAPGAMRTSRQVAVSQQPRFYSAAMKLSKEAAEKEAAEAAEAAAKEYAEQAKKIKPGRETKAEKPKRDTSAAEAERAAKRAE